MRVVPRANDAINETWIADRDRFSYEGFYTPDRAQKPHGQGRRRRGARSTGRPRSNPPRRACSSVVRESGPAQVGFLASPISSLEELALTAKVARGLGTNNIDHRLRRVDFRDQANDPVAPTLGCSARRTRAGRGRAGHRLQRAQGSAADRAPHPPGRRASRQPRSRSSIRRRYDVQVPGRGQPDQQWPRHGAAPGGGAGWRRCERRASRRRRIVAATLEASRRRSQHEAVARRARRRANGEVVLLGALAQRHVAYCRDPRAGAGAGCRHRCDARATCPKAATAWAPRSPGVLPHRTAGGRPVRAPGPQRERNARRAPEGVRAGGRHRSGRPRAGQRRSKPSLRGADVRRRDHAVRERGDPGQRERDPAERPSLPRRRAPGSMSKGAGRASPAPRKPPGEARPAWKILRVLGNLLGLPGFEYVELGRSA